MAFAGEYPQICDPYFKETGMFVKGYKENMKKIELETLNLRNEFQTQGWKHADALRIIKKYSNPEMARSSYHQQQLVSVANRCKNQFAPALTREQEIAQVAEKVFKSFTNNLSRDAAIRAGVDLSGAGQSETLQEEVQNAAATYIVENAKL